MTIFDVVVIMWAGRLIALPEIEPLAVSVAVEVTAIWATARILHAYRTHTLVKGEG